MTGTDLSFDVTDDLSGYADLTDRTYPSETRDVARCEFLAWAVYSSAVEHGSLAELRSAAATPARSDVLWPSAQRGFATTVTPGEHVRVQWRTVNQTATEQPSAVWVDGFFLSTDTTWSGDDSRGRSVPAGVYFARLEIGGTPVSTRRLIKLR